MKMIAALEPACADTCLRRERDRRAQTGDLPISDPPCLLAGARMGGADGPGRPAWHLPLSGSRKFRLTRPARCC